MLTVKDLSIIQKVAKKMGAYAYLHDGNPPRLYVSPTTSSSLSLQFRPGEARWTATFGEPPADVDLLGALQFAGDLERAFSEAKQLPEGWEISNGYWYFRALDFVVSPGAVPRLPALLRYLRQGEAAAYIAAARTIALPTPFKVLDNVVTFDARWFLSHEGLDGKGPIREGRAMVNLDTSIREIMVEALEGWSWDERGTHWTIDAGRSICSCPQAPTNGHLEALQDLVDVHK